MQAADDTTATSSNNPETEPDINSEETPPTAKKRLSINHEERQSDSRPETVDPQPGSSAPQDGMDKWLGEENNQSDQEEHQSDHGDLENSESSDPEEYDRHYQLDEQGQFLQELGDFADNLEIEEERRAAAEPVGLPDPDDAIIPPDGAHWTEPPGQDQLDRAAGAGPAAYEVDSYITSLLQQLQEPSVEPDGLPNPDDALVQPARKKR